MIKKLLLTFFLFLVQATFFAATNTYTGATTVGGKLLWSTASNWSLGTVPSASDDVVIPSGKTVIPNITTISVNSITISGTMDLDKSVTTTINSQLIVVTSPNGHINFDHSILILPSNVALYLQNGSTSLNGSCNNNDEIYVGSVQYAVCVGGGALYLFAEIEAAGGINVVSAGVIGTAQSICTGFTPLTLTSTTAGTGLGTITYEWQTNASGSYVTIPGATSATYSPPALTATTSYKRRTKSVFGGFTFYSAYTTSVTITVNPKPNNVINGFSATTICAGGSPQLTFNAEASSFSTPYSIIYKNDVTLIQYTIAIPSASAYSFTPGDNPTSNTGYTLVSISNASCTTTTAGIVDSGANLIVRPMPTTTISGTTAVCLGDPSPNITFTNPQTAGITVTYTVNGITAPTVSVVAGTTTVPATTTVSVPTTTAGPFVYALVSVDYTTSPSCTQPLTGSATVTINTIPAAPTVGIPTQPTCALATGSVVLSGLPSGGTINPGAISYAGTTCTISGLATGTYNYTVSNETCTSVASGNVVIGPQPGTPVTPTIFSYTLPTFADNDGTITLTNLPSGNWVGHQIKDGVTTTNISGTGSPVTITGLSMGSYEFEVVETCISPRSTPRSLTVVPYSPIVSAATAITCTGFTANWPATPTATGYLLDVSTDSSFGSFIYHDLSVSALSSSITGIPSATLYYRIRARNATQISQYSATITVAPLINTYDAGSWSLGTPPTTVGTQNLIFNSSVGVGDLSGCSCTVNSGVDVTISSGKTLTVTNGVSVLGSGTLSFDDTSSLVQINDAAVNSGVISYSRSLPVLRDTDYVYWSSPVAGQTLIGFSPNSPSDKFYSYDADADVWHQESSSNIMNPGVGYIIRAPLPPSGASPPGIKPFEGEPNNGVIPLPTINPDYSYLIGNPYPSAVDADLFLDINKNAIDGTVYFWTHNTAIQDATLITGTNPDGSPKAGSGTYAYTGDDYALYNGVGGTGSVKPEGKIAAGQGFFIIGKPSTTGTAMFNNSMRVSGNNGQFYKQSNKTKSKVASAVEKNRVWLNLTNTEGLFKQTLVGYVTGATNGIDNAYDGESFDANQYADFYSIQGDKNLTIQGRALPFDVTDEVPLGYRSAIAGQLSIKIDQTDGVLASQDVFIEDKLTNGIHNLKQSPYQFTTAVGTFDDRFVLRYTNASNTSKTLSTNYLKTLDNSILVSNKNKQLKVNSSIENIDKIMIYDLLGRQIYKKNSVNSNEFSISNLNAAQQTIIVKVALQNGQIISKKIIY